MRHTLLLLLFLGLSWSCFQAKPVVFDNDMAIDDWAALLYLLLCAGD
jgi:pyrimidine-specific ribonucleoside hydrolase